jgi:hypothetical protein
MKGLPRRPRRVAQTHAVAEKQKYLAVPYGEIKAASAAGAPAVAFKNASVTRFSRTVVSVDYVRPLRSKVRVCLGARLFMPSVSKLAEKAQLNVNTLYLTLSEGQYRTEEPEGASPGHWHAAHGPSVAQKSRLNQGIEQRSLMNERIVRSAKIIEKW